MSFLKQKLSKNYPNSGFTLIELVVVIGLFVMLAGFIIANYATTRGARNLKIAQNQVMTNVRKIQSYSLSSRNAPSGLPTKFHMVEFGSSPTGTPPYNSRYFNETVDTAYAVAAPEILNLPQGIIVSGITITQNGTTGQALCVQLMFAAPFAKLYTYFRGDTNCGGIVVSSGVVQSPGQLLSLADSTTVITLQDTTSLATKTVTIYGVSGKMEASP